MNDLKIGSNTLLALGTMAIGARETKRLTAAMALGQNIQSASHNPAGLRISDVMTAHIKGLEVAVSNLHNGISLVQTAEAALAGITDTLQRMRELAVQASTGTIDSTQRGMLDQEYQQLKQNIALVVEETTWNEQRLFNKLSPTSFELQAGPNAGQRITITIPQIYASGSLISFENGDFENGNVGSSTVPGWTVMNNRVTLDGNSTVGGWPTPVDSTKPAPSGGDAVASSSASFASQIVTTDNPSGGTKSLLLESSGVSVAGYGIVHGPVIVSDNAAELEAGAVVSFDWKASGGDDAYDVYAYLLNIDNGSTVTLLDESGESGAMTTSWSSVSKSVPDAGNYKFVFVSGTFDATGGTAAGARLFVDNIQAPPKEKPSLDATYIASVGGAGLSIAQVDAEIESVNRARAALGATVNRILHAVDNLDQRVRDTTHSRSGIVDTDYAAAASELSRLEALKSGATFALTEARKIERVQLEMIQSNKVLFRA